MLPSARIGSIGRLLACTLSMAIAASSLGRPATAMSTEPGVDMPCLATPRAKPRVTQSIDSLPVRFEPNVGQVPGHALFVVGGPGGVSLTASGAVFGGGTRPVTLAFTGASPSPEPKALDALPGKANYLRGDDPSLWHTNVPTFAKVRYDAFYPGIDLVWYGKGSSLEYDLVVATGADPGAVAFRLDGTATSFIDDDGAIVTGDVRLERPIAFQQSSGVRRPVACRYVQRDDGSIAFALGEYDRSMPLVIDPEIGYTYTFSDSGKDISIFGIAVDPTGAAYVAGRTRTAGAGGVLTIEAFVSKLNPEGTALVYTTTFGGSAGNEEAKAIDVDASGNAYITGFAFSSNFPTTAGAFQTTKGSPNGTQDAFVMKLASGGDAFVYASFLGGSGGTSANAIAIDGSGNTYVTGFTQSGNFPTTTPAQATFGGVRDAFLTKVNVAGSAKSYSTYLGGSQSDTGNGVAVDSSGNAYVVGVTTSTNFPVTAGTIQTASGGGSEAFWARYDSTGQRVASTYLGGSGFDSANGVDVDATGNSFVTGETDSASFPLAAPLQPSVAGDRDAFVSALNPTGTALNFSTFYGGSQYDYGTAIALDGLGALYFVGTTSSNDFPVVDPVQSLFGGGASDAFVVRLQLGTPSSRIALPVAPTVESASYQGGTGRESGTASKPTGSIGVAVGSSRQKDTGGSGHDEASVTTYNHTRLEAPDLTVTATQAGTLTIDGVKYVWIFIAALSTSKCSNTLLAPNATFGIRLPDGVRFKGIFSPHSDVTVEESPPLDQSGRVVFHYPESVQRLNPNQEPIGIASSASVLVTLDDRTTTALSVDLFASTTGAVECDYGNNQRTQAITLQGYGLGYLQGRKTLQAFRYFLDGTTTPALRMIGNAFPIQNHPRRTTAAPGLVGLNIYMSTSPGVEPVEGNLVGFIPADETLFDVSEMPDGAYFILTAVTESGESRPSNEVGGTLPSVSSLKVSATKLTAQGAGFASDVQVIFADLDFEQVPKLKRANTKLVQKGQLETGVTIGEFSAYFLTPGSKVLVLFVNGNGNAVAYEYTR